MGFSIFLRTNRHVSYFKRNLLDLIRSPRTNHLLICSGYISMPSLRSPYSILGDQLLSEIVAHCKEVTVIGSMGPGIKYEQFIRTLSNAPINLSAYKAINKKWHAKIAIKLKDNEPIAGLICSSNLTAPAYRENHSWFNHECDVLIWKNKPIYNKHFKKLAEKAADPLGPVYMTLDKKVNQADEMKRLKGIYEIVKNEKFLRPYKI